MGVSESIDRTAFYGTFIQFIDNTYKLEDDLQTAVKRLVGLNYEYTKINRVIFVRLSEGEDLIRSVGEISEEEKGGSASSL